VAGDFNSVCRREDRRGVNNVGGLYPTAEMYEFGDFIVSKDLVDLPLLGRKFTWFHPNGSSMSRIDRFLISEEWLNDWGCVRCGLFLGIFRIIVRLFLRGLILIGVQSRFVSIIIGLCTKIIRMLLRKFGGINLLMVGWASC
jgi:hypothetical protein